MQLQRDGGHSSNKFGLVTIPLATVAIFTDNVSKGTNKHDRYSTVTILRGDNTR